jgi:glutamate/tyrosine decarboxylase-like PLP-dependent enzyme
LRARAAEPDVERYLDDLNQTLLDQSQRGGEAFVSNAVVRGRYALRACIVNFHTSRRDVEELPEILARTGRTLDRERRPASLGAAPA